MKRGIALKWQNVILEQGLFNFKLSFKSSDIFLAIKSYELLSDKCDYPLHLGIAEAGGLITGSIKSSIGIGQLLMEGIGDTIRVSLSSDPVDEIKAGDKKSTELNPNQSTYLNNLGFAKFKIGDKKNAIKDLNKAININPNDLNAHNNLGVIKYELGDYYGAISDHTKAIEIDPNIAKAYYNRGIRNEELKEY